MSKVKKIDGKTIAQEIQQEVKDQIEKLGIEPGLGVILVGGDKASERYVELKQKAAQKAGINFYLYRFEQDAKEAEILETIDWLNKDEQIDAILVQLPLPKHLGTDKIIKAINPKKDVDGFHPENNDLVPGLNLGIAQLLQSTGENLSQKSGLIIAKSKEFISSLAKTLEAFGIKVGSASPDAKNLQDKTQATDIIITAAGKPGYIAKDDIKQGAILIDVGTTYVHGKTVGDVDFKSCEQKASWITPVPGGVGPMTVVMLLKNTVALASKK